MLTFRVRERDRQGWGGMALITVGNWICIPALMLGGILSEGLSLTGLAVCTAAAGLILLACALFMGIQSSNSGLPSTVVSADCLGVWGARCISALLMTITGIGWFGAQIAVCGTSFSVITANVMGFSIPAWISTLFWGTLMTVSAVNGYRVLRSLSFVIVPVLLLILICTVIHRVFFSETGSPAALFAWRPAEPMSYVTAITMMVGCWAMGAYVVGDYYRYAKTRRNTALSISVSLVPVIPLIFFSGAVFHILEGNSDITVILSGMGFPAISLIFLVLAAWTTNVLDTYTSGIALSVLLGLEEKRLKLSTALAGITGTVLGATGILSLFTDFLSLLSSLVPPLFGVLMGAKIISLLGCGGKERESGRYGAPRDLAVGEGIKPGFHLPGIIAYGLGALTAWLTTAVVPVFIPPVNGIIAAAAAYILLEKLFPSATR